MADNPVETWFLAGISTVGTGLVTFALGYPDYCTGGGAQLPGYETEVICYNVLGFQTIMLDPAQALFVGGAIGVLVGLCVFLYRRASGKG